MGRRDIHPLTDLTRIAPVDWARLAAFIDGEGCILSACSVHKDPKFAGTRTRYEYIRVVVTNTDPRLSKWILETFGGHIIDHSNNKQRNKNWKPCFFWQVSCAKAARILTGCRPYLILKGEQADVAMALQDTMIYSGRRGTPQSVVDHRAELQGKLRVLNARGPQETAAAS